ncbi:hypothetical protein [Hyalangium rubrum]|uniref:Lipoprotein n=1 Tax=Hyalangium rubrum TaxID=3103134 RepID=A0ABU5H9D8_9BACT|nr:hypothetical protein [Hyalangium sp. s54d21]MDY7229453.1 hypothetical protein [Hyalangium sp. s54d21]
MKDSNRLAPSRAALLVVPLLALSCGGETKPPIKDPPQAVLSVPQPNTVGQKLTVQVSATGCDQIQTLAIYDQETQLKTVAYSGSGTVTVDLQQNEIPYTRGIAALLSLKARVICTDGRQNDSQPQPATFFPVAEVIEPAAGSGLQVVPDYFVAEGSGGSVNFIGCGNDVFGAPFLFRVTKTGPAISQISKAMPRGYVCTSATSISGLDPSSRKRWLWTPNVGAFAFDEQLNITGRTAVKLDLLSVGPGGDALVYDASRLYRMSHEDPNGVPKWAYATRGSMIAAALPRNDGRVMVPSVTSDNTPGNDTAIVVSLVDYGDQNPNTGGLETQTYLMTRLTAAELAADIVPPATFNADGSLLYLALPGANNLTQVIACATQGNGCEGTAQRWASQYLPGQVVATVPFANGSRLAAIAPQKVWILNASNGAIMNKDQAPLSPEGALLILQVQPGAGNFPQAFYLLAGPIPQDGLPAPQPLEIIGTDTAEKGELFRYQVNAGSIASAVDSAGALWLRIGANLVRPLTPSEYRQVRP